MDESFGATLRRFRLRACLPENALAKRAGIDASYVNRLSTCERRRPTQEVVLALARCLGLSPADTDTLLLAAGYAPTWLQYLGSGDSTVAAVARFLTDDNADASLLADFRAMVETLAARMAPSPPAIAPPAPPRRLVR